MNILPIGLALLCGGVLFLLLFIGGLILVLNTIEIKREPAPASSGSSFRE
jgi:hypothetical protein